MAVTLGDLGQTSAQRRVVILGAMKELGAQSDDLHAGLSAPIIAAHIDQCILVGEEMQILSEKLANMLEYKGQVAHVADSSQALDQLRTTLNAGDAILVKGSNSLGLGSVVKALTDELPADGDA